jgi:hypothetical protein
MDNTFVDRFIDRRYRRVQKLGALRLIVIGQRGPKLFYLCAQTGAVAAVDRIPLDILSDPFFG